MDVTLQLAHGILPLVIVSWQKRAKGRHPDMTTAESVDRMRRGTEEREQRGSQGIVRARVGY